MIVSRTPFRVTLGGGGTDLPSYYKEHGGFIFAIAINSYMYVNVNQRLLDNKVILHYTEAEVVDHIDQLKHELAREALRVQSIFDSVEISSLADIPAGTGVGSSSCYLVGLLTALQHFRKAYLTRKEIAELACDIELNVLNKKIGKQDQYMATYGGVTRLDIAKDGNVDVTPINLSPSAQLEFVRNTHIYYTGNRRSAEDILVDQHAAMEQKGKPNANLRVEESLNMIKDLGYRIFDAVVEERFDDWGDMLHEHWENKKRMSDKISLSEVDVIYDHVRKEFGVLGGKIIGAGGGGFLMLYTNDGHKELENYMRSKGMRRLNYFIEPEGAKIVSSLSSFSR